MAAACKEVDAERGEGEADSPRAVGSPLLFDEVMMRGRALDGEEGGSELRSGAMSTGDKSIFEVVMSRLHRDDPTKDASWYCCCCPGGCQVTQAQAKPEASSFELTSRPGGEVETRRGCPGKLGKKMELLWSTDTCCWWCRVRSGALVGVKVRRLKEGIG